jgi:hypothetical protein
MKVSEKTLRELLDRLSKDEAYRDTLRNDWQNALDDLELTPAELAALASQDEDALRRLSGSNVSAASAGFFGTAFICSWLCITTIDTRGSTRDTCPGSKKGCGTHNTHNCLVMIR